MLTGLALLSIVGVAGVIDITVMGGRMGLWISQWSPWGKK